MPLPWGNLVRSSLILGASFVVFAAACGADDPVVTPATTSASTAATGGSGAGGDDSTAATGGMPEPECPHTGPPVLDPASLPTCEGHETCRCLNSALVPPDNLSDLADCDAENKCVPDLLIETLGNFIPETCASVGGFEGRCLNACLPAIAAQADLLPQDICGLGELCAPCYDPFDQTETGACSQSCDPGPVDPPGMFTRCCDDRGSCIDSASIPPDDASNLGEDTCTPDAELCVPDGFADNTYVAQACTTSLIVLAGPEYGPGACLHDCLPAVSNFLIREDGCGEGFKCAPCLDPQNGGAPTGACDYLP